MTNPNSISLLNLDMSIASVFDVTVQGGAVVLHDHNARIVLGVEVVAAIDQARAEAQADTELDANRTAAP